MPDLSKFTLHLIVLAALVLTTVALAIYRMINERENDYHIHVSADEAMSVGKQDAVAHRIGAVDKLGKAFTVVTVVYFFVVLGLVLYNEWLRSSSTVMVN